MWCLISEWKGEGKLKGGGEGEEGKGVMGWDRRDGRDGRDGRRIEGGMITNFQCELVIEEKDNVRFCCLCR